MVKIDEKFQFQNGVDELGPVPELEPVPVLGPPSDPRREIRARALIRTFTVVEKKFCDSSHMCKIFKVIFCVLDPDFPVSCRLGFQNWSHLHARVLIKEPAAISMLDTGSKINVNQALFVI